MIKYAIKCDNGHHFDAWFDHSSSFDFQQKSHYISCPHCDSTNVEKALMAPAVASSSFSKELGIEANQIKSKEMVPEATTSPTVSLEVEPTNIPEPLLHGSHTMDAVLNKMRELREWVKCNATNVGDQFASEVRRIHRYQDEPSRNVFGKATFEEAQELLEEGIHFMPLPALPEDNH